MKVRSLITTCFFLFFILNINAQENYSVQKRYTKKHLQEDLEYLNNFLVKGHPALYWYSSKEDYSEAFEKLKKDLTSEMTELEFLNEVAKLNQLIKCTHSDIRPSVNYDRFWKDSVNLIPFNILKVKSDFVISQNFSKSKELNYGTKIISINGLKISDIVEHLLPYIPADGDNETRKYDALTRGFYRYYSYYMNSESKSFKVVYENQRGERAELKVEGLKKSDFDQRRNAHNLSLPPTPPVSFELLDSLSTGILKIHTFRNDLMEKEHIVFENFISDCFKKLKDKGTKNLIIDLRGNGGGYSEYAAHLFTFLADTSFRYCKKQVLSSDGPIEGVQYDIPKTFAGFPDGIVLKDGQYQWTQHSTLAWRAPSAFRFKGNVYFLIDGGCSSTTSELASLARSENIGIFIGQEVGGCYMGNSGGVLGWFELPNTKIRVRMGMVKFEMVEPEPLIKHGVLPDIEVEYSREDRIQDKDLEMERCLLKIKSSLSSKQ